MKNLQIAGFDVRVL